MKKFFLSVVCIVISFYQGQGQNEGNNENKHEFRLDALEILATPSIDISYEYVINKFSGAGITTYLSLGDTDNVFPKYAFDPYFRQYFLNKQDFGARGLFVEGLVRFAGGENETDIVGIGSNSLGTDNWFDIGVGFVIGQKWTSQNGFVFEISLGGGRYFLDDNDNIGFLKGGILIGYRLF
ncbi:hypothetical protein [Aquimarina pacifica]|uniref:hypothetical protein n=1 Tax=Aquimarina pacifica TaxID=1296415 RepID=UPI000471DA82|nr:hypothetical protein [Aquimarina pacifica]